MHTLTVLTVTILSLAHHAHARGAGRAFPLHSENYAIENFQTVNPGIEWDPTNYLVDKSGQYANCHNIRVGYEDITDRTPEGQSIGAVLDYVEGEGVDAESVHGYITDTIDKWMRSGQHHGTIRGADRFGCSVRPGCRHRFNTVTTIACLFSPAGYQNPRDPPGGQEGLAFTPDQYDMAERITGQRWDESHMLENLSGYEITCAMVNDIDWGFAKAIKMAQDEFGMAVLGLKGEARNLGSTQDAMETIMEHFKQIQRRSMVGCSVIPDCIVNRGNHRRDMYVVVACIYEDPAELHARLERENRIRGLNFDNFDDKFQ